MLTLRFEMQVSEVRPHGRIIGSFADSFYSLTNSDELVALDLATENGNELTETGKKVLRN